MIGLRYWLGVLLFVFASLVLATTSVSEMKTTAASPVDIPVGIFVTSLYDLDFSGNKYTMTAWVWATYCPQKPEGEGECPDQYPAVPANYLFADSIEIVNSRKWSINPTEKYIIDNDDGSVRSMSKFTAVLHQQWNMTEFPFDHQLLNLEIESVEFDATAVRFIADRTSSLVSDDFTLNGWNFSEPKTHVRMHSKVYQYPTSFGDVNNAIQSYSRLYVEIPIEREGIRIFWTAFLGFFASYVILSMLHLFSQPMIDIRVGLIMSALFATVGNKYTIDLLLPPQSFFTFADVIQYATFVIVAIGLFSTVMISRYSNSGNDKLVEGINRWMFWLIILGYPVIIYLGSKMTA